MKRILRDTNLLHVLLKLKRTRAIAQAVSHWLPNAAARVRAKVT
jgi:hypothetical protein